MARLIPIGPAPAAGGQPLSERVDKAGMRQHQDPEGAKASRQQSRDEEQDARGWWWNEADGSEDAWVFYGEGDLPDIAPEADALELHPVGDSSIRPGHPAERP